jgi:OOP family OmpA-OmpF porin
VSYLADHGVAEGRMSPHGYGKTNFVATNKTAEGRAQNRRVELVPNQ